MSAAHFAIGTSVVVDGLNGSVLMETATQLLVRFVDDAGERDDRWVPRSSATLEDGSIPLPQRPAAASGSRGAVPPAGDAGLGADDDLPEDDECFVCGKEGRLTCCDVCPRVYHLRCLPAADAALLKKAGSADEDWWCPRCRRLVQLSFAMGRELSHPAVGAAGASDDVARRLFAFMSEQQDASSWDELREAGSALLHAMPLTPPWQPRAHDVGDVASQHAAELLAARVEPEWWPSGAAASMCMPAMRTHSGGGEAAEEIRSVPSTSDGEANGSSGAAAGHGHAAGAANGGSVANGGGGKQGGGGGGGGSGRGGGGSGKDRVRSSEYRGVSRRYGKWKARIRQEGTDIIIGDYDNELDAARAYDKKARVMHGEKAQLNFPDLD